MNTPSLDWERITILLMQKTLYVLKTVKCVKHAIGVRWRTEVITLLWDQLLVVFCHPYFIWVKLTDSFDIVRFSCKDAKCKSVNTSHTSLKMYVLSRNKKIQKNLLIRIQISQIKQLKYLLDICKNQKNFVGTDKTIPVVQSKQTSVCYS